jgi:hypothetical protein
MGARTPIALLACATAVLAGLGAPGVASASDASATHAYLQANYSMLRSAHTHLRAAEAAPRKLRARLRRECPAAAHGSPQDEQSTQLSNEVIGAMVISAYRVDLPAIRRFISSTARLRWSNAALTARVRSYRSNLRTLIGLAQPAVCADVRAWTASGYSTLAPSTVTFDARFIPNWVVIGLRPRTLSRFEGAQEHTIAARSKAIEDEISEAEARAVETWGGIIDELGVWP